MNELMQRPANNIKRNIVRSIKDEDVYDLLRKIPPGKVSTYGDLAKALGNPSSFKGNRIYTCQKSESNKSAMS